MSKRALSVTLEADNIAWLKARAGTTGARSLSTLLDDIVTTARRTRTGPSRSVVGTIDIAPDDPALAEADAAVRAAFDTSLRRPFVVREGQSQYRARSKKRRG